MTLICYTTYKPKPETARTIRQVQQIVDAYRAKNLKINLRGIYYQLVTKNLIPNKREEYDRLKEIVGRARMAGMLHWESIEDRTRRLRENNHWDDPAEMMQSAIDWYEEDKWAGQPVQPEVWIEKDALAGVIEGVCEELDVPWFSCRGYGSMSELWKAGQRISRRWGGDENGEAGKRQPTIIFHLGDHDPSGKDMTWDIWKRLAVFQHYSPKSVDRHYEHEEAFNTTVFDAVDDFSVRRLALNWDQIEEYDPPPNPAKQTDSRHSTYETAFGEASWELDALEPEVIIALIREAVLGVRDDDAWFEAVEAQEAGRSELRDLLHHHNSSPDRAKET